MPKVELGVHKVSVSGDFSSSLDDNQIKPGILMYMILDINVTIINYGESVVINATLVNTTENGTMTILINDQEYGVPIENGSAILTLHNVAPNSYIVVSSYKLFNQNISSTAYYDIQLRDSNLTISVNNITAGQNATINITVTNGTSGNIFVFVNNKMHILTLSNSTAQLNLTNLAGGEYNVYVVYNGDNYFKGCYGNTTFKVSTIVPYLYVNTTNGIVGQPVLITVKAPNDISGKVYVYVNNKEYEFSTNDISFTVPNLPAGNYTVRVSYNGDSKYLSNSNTTSFNITKKDISMSISTEYIKVGQNETIELMVPSDATGLVVININGTTYSVYANNTKAILIIPNLRYGVYNVNATYLEDDLYTKKSVQSVFKVDKVEINPKIAYDVNENLVAQINITVPSDFSGNLKIEMDGKNYTVFLSNNLGRVIVSDLDGGEYDAKLYVENDSKYEDTTKNFVLKLTKIISRIHIDAPAIHVGDNATITVSLPSDATGNVTIRINNKNYSSNLTNGVAVFNISNLPYSNYEIYANYSGDRKYSGDEEDAILVVRKVDPSPYSYMNVTSIYVGEIATINITLPSDAAGKVNITIQNKNYIVNITKGHGQINISNLRYGVPVPIHAFYSGDDKYLSCEREYTAFAVHRIPNYQVNITANTNETAANITVMIPEDANGPGYINISNGTSSIKWDVTFINGKANITATNLNPGSEYIVYAYFEGNDKYTANDAYKTLNSEKTLDYVFDVSGDDIYVGETSFLRIYLPNATVGDNIVIRVRGQNPVTIQVQGNTTIYPIYNLTSGSHEISVTYEGNSKYDARSRYGNISVSKISYFSLRTDINTPYVNENITFNITLPSDAKGNVTVRINNTDYPCIVVNGTAYVVAKGLSAGTYNATVFYTGDDIVFYENNISYNIHI